jgi:hypothetical protein
VNGHEGLGGRGSARSRWKDAMDKRERAVGHIAKEYSTLDWIMEGLLMRAGFAVQRIVDSHASRIQYLCRAL